MEKHTQFVSALQAWGKAKPKPTWESEGSMPIEFVTYSDSTVKGWKAKGYEEADGEAERRLAGQLDADTTGKMVELQALFAGQDNLVSYVKPGKSEVEKTLLLLVYFKDWFVGVKTTLIET